MSGKQKVAAVRCAGYDQALIGKKLDLLMTAIGADTLIQPGMSVLIKPNLLSAKTPEEFTTTHPEVLRAVIRYVHRHGGNVTLADSPAGRFTPDSIQLVYQKTGLRALAQEEGCRLNENLGSVDSGLRAGSEPVPVLECVAQADLIIDCCKFKSHSYTVASGAVKNMFGVIPGLVKAQMHARFPQRESFCRFLCQFCAHVKPQLCVMDAVEGMQGNGPSSGDRYDGQRLLAALDPFALDYGALTLLGIDPDQTPIHREAVKLGLVDPEAIELIAPEEAWESLIRHDFRLPETMKGLIQLIPSPLAALRRHFAPYPKPDAARCLGCGECVRDCPVQAITLADHKAVVDRRRCIRCYCCQEVCPAHVVQLKR
ncbi:DUF362 domain-containing protein [Holdemania filiformis]|uniref:DUF362 domain-containing protein n=1 Tax=Holdemania filiformis TaxID=61171 RepID=A0A412FG61_9FIRM|nr:DUF362 domain-containing protein [Holdemania filiformis]RGR67099.1 DUF362 domain-containing protein [Holdemania filiformis]